MATTSRESHPLPLASFVAQRAPTHPLPRLVTDPVLPRIAHLEAALLTSRPAALFLRLGIASERSIVALALAALAAALARWRAQWRAVLWALGLGEALSRTVRLLQRQAAASDGEGKQHGQGGSDDVDDAEETQHVLSFWLFFAALSLLDTLRSTPSGPSSSFASSALSFLALPTRARAALQSARRTYLHFVRLWILPSFLRLRWAGRALVAKYPRLDPAPRFAYFTAFPYAFPRLYPSPSSSPSSVPARRAAGNFPQPRSRPWDPLPTSLPLSWSYFAYPSTSSLAHPALAPTYSPRAAAAAEARWELVRLVLLWVALRRDAWGAKSLVWDWTLAPLLGALPGGGGAGAADEPTTVLRVVREVVGARAAGRGAAARESSESARPQTSQDDPDVPLSPSGSTSSASATPRRATTAAAAGRDYPTPSPYALSWTPPRPAAPSSSAAARARASAPASHASSSRTASPARPPRAPFALQDPPAARAGTARSGALLGGSSGAARAGRGRRAAPGGGEGLLSPGLSAGGSRGSGREEDDEWDVDAEAADDDSDVPPATPGEEEAEEGARRWATVLAEAHAAELLVDVEGSGELVGAAGEGEGHDGEPGWSR